jgi:hypothetical protein
MTLSPPGVAQAQRPCKGGANGEAPRVVIDGRSKMNKGELVDALRNHWPTETDRDPVFRRDALMN